MILIRCHCCSWVWRPPFLAAAKRKKRGGRGEECILLKICQIINRLLVNNYRVCFFFFILAFKNEKFWRVKNLNTKNFYLCMNEGRYLIDKTWKKFINLKWARTKYLTALIPLEAQVPIFKCKNLVANYKAFCFRAKFYQRLESFKITFFIPLGN